MLLPLSSATIKADEGMWMLNSIDSRVTQTMQDLGLQLSPKDLYSTNTPSLSDAVIDFGDYCSGVVVSPDGLVFTNYHCGFSSIQALSTPEDDILKKGFVARSHAEEKPVEGLFVRFLERTVNCTSRVMTAMNGLPNNKLDSVMNAVEEEYNEAYPDRYCVVKSYFTSNAFYVSIYKVYDDVRLVLSIPSSMGKFGGDTDNWMWPRQTCDFSVFRIYTSPEGEPADYSPDNVPLKAERYAKVSLDGYQPGDFCMTIGFPGSTSRYLSSYGVNLRVNASNVALIDVRGKKQDVWKRWMNEDRALAIKYASKFASSSNYWKNSIGMNKAVADLRIIEEKEELEQIIRDWYSADPQLNTRFSSMLDELEKAYTNIFDATRAQSFFRETFMRGIELQKPADILSALPSNADSAEVAKAHEKLQLFYKDYEPHMDEEVMAVLLENYRGQVDARFLPSCYETIDKDYGGDYKAYAKEIFGSTILTDSTCLEKFLADSTLLLSDKGSVYAEELSTKYDEITGGMKADKEVVTYNEHLLTQAILERDQETPHYSDANFSMRLSYGYVQDYSAGGTQYNYYTNSQSLLDKVAKQEEISDYKLDANVATLVGGKDFGRYADKRTGDLQLCFLSNNDITGGNSGSPMFNGKGELIGLAFDGNWEAMSGDISFDVDLQRCIGVDIRFVLYLIDKWGHADNLIQEMGL